MRADEFLALSPRLFDELVRAHNDLNSAPAAEAEPAPEYVPGLAVMQSLRRMAARSEATPAVPSPE